MESAVPAEKTQPAQAIQDSDLRSCWSVGVLTASFQTVVGYPLETIKTRLQTSGGAREQLVASFSGLYRGAAVPFVSQILIHPWFFFVYTELHERHGLSSFLAGAGSGIVSGVLTTPMEARKTATQAALGTTTIGKTALPLSNRWWWCWGLLATTARDTLGCAVYWDTFERWKDWRDEHRETYPVWYAGGVAGVCSWMTSYPLDLWKTRAQTRCSTRQTVSASVCAVLVTCVRAFLVNAGILAIYDRSRR